MGSSEFLDWAASITLILGTFGAAWKWIFAELLRRQMDKRHPALEGTISVETFKHSEGKVIVRVLCTWKNLSSSKIYLNVSKTHISIYDLIDNFDFGAVSLKSSKTLFLYRHEPYEGATYVFYEPGSTSELVATFIVVGGRSYGVRAVVEMDAARMGVEDVNWSRETAFATSV